MRNERLSLHPLPLPPFKQDVGEKYAEWTAEGKEAYVVFYNKPKEQKEDGRTASNDTLDYEKKCPDKRKQIQANTDTERGGD